VISDVSDISAHYGGLLIILIYTAMNKNFEDYLKAILEHYEIVKNGKDADLLENPTPGNLKKLCLQLLEKGLSNSDEQLFMIFFHPTGEQTLFGIIRTMNADSRLRTPSDFLRSKQGLTNNRQHANLVAVVVGFEPRPFTTFQNRVQNEEEEKRAEEEKTAALAEKEISKEEIQQEEAKIAAPQHPEKQIQTVTKSKPNTARPRKIALVSAAVLLFGGMSGFIIHKTNEKQCMVWRENHYERIDCQQSTIHALMDVDKIQPYNEELFAQEKIIPTDTTTFFKNGKAVVYYLKKDKRYEFFKQPGFHPIYNDKKLRHITTRILSRWKSCSREENPNFSTRQLR